MLAGWTRLLLPETDASSQKNPREQREERREHPEVRHLRTAVERGGNTLHGLKDFSY